MTGPSSFRRLGDPYPSSSWQTVSVTTSSTQTVYSIGTVYSVSTVNSMVTVAFAMPSMLSSTVSYSASSMQCWQSVRTTVNGVATFWPTTTGNASGTTLFSMIHSIGLTPKANTSSPVAVPGAAVKAISADLKSFTANVSTGVTLIVLGNTSIFAADGTEVFAVVWGLPYTT